VGRRGPHDAVRGALPIPLLTVLGHPDDHPARVVLDVCPHVQIGFLPEITAKDSISTIFPFVIVKPNTTRGRPPGAHTAPAARPSRRQ
jgi:hypothetical protein